MALLRVRLFGGMELAWDERPLPSPPGAAARSLLAYLLTYRDRPHTRDLLAGTFWPQLPDARARRRLSQALWQVGCFWQQGLGRGGLALPIPLLRAEGATVQIDPRLPLWLDSEEFARQHARCTTGGDPEAGMGAVALYRGEFLAGHYDDWAAPERERLREMLLEVLAWLLERYKGAGDYDRALTYARRLAAEDPWHEGAHREVMRLYHLAGRHAEALAQYQACRRVLAEELGSVPAPETAALAAEIAARTGLPAPSLLPATARSAPVPLLERPDQMPLVGRQAELAELVRQVEMAAAGSGGLTILYGEAGVGKSRLLREVAGNAEWRGMQAAWGRCYELTAPLTYQPLVEVLRARLAALRRTALAPPWWSELARLLPELASEWRPSPVPSPADRQHLLEAIASALLSLAAARPMVVLLEDAQWMDLASLEVLRYILPRLSNAALLILVSVRSEELAGRPAAALAAMEDMRLVRRLDLGGLDRAETAELVQRALGMEQTVERFSARLYAGTEGNPFFLLETLRTLVQEGLLYRDNEGLWSTPWDESTVDYGELPLPSGVAQSIARRLERLSPRERELLQLAAVIGRQVDFPLWLAASGREEGELLAGADALCAAGLLAAGRRSGGGADYAFGHDLIRRACYEQLSEPRRRACHQRVAQALEQLSPGEPAALAYHWTAARSWEKAVRWHRLAGERARTVYAHADAVAHYTQALAALGKLPAPRDLLCEYDLRLARESAYDLAGERRAQAEDLQALEALADALDDDERRAEVALRQAGYANATGDLPAAIAASQRAIALAQARNDAGREAAGYLQWGQALNNQGASAAARTPLGAAVSIAHRQGFLSAEAEGLRLLGSTHWCLGDYDQAGVYYARSLEICRRIGDRRGERMALNNLGLVRVQAGRHDLATAHFEQALAIAREIGDPWGESKALTNLANVSMAMGNFTQATALARQALEISRQVGARSNEGVLLLYLGNLALRQGDCAAAGAHAEEALAILRRIGDRRLEGAALNNLGEIALCAGRYTQALQYLEMALSISAELGDRQSAGPCWQDMGQVYHRLGAYALAAACYRKAMRIYRQNGEAAREGEIHNLRGLLHYHQGRLPAARRSSRQALAIAERVGSRPIQAYAWTHLGHILAELGRPDAADAAYHRALQIRRDGGQPHLAMENLAGLTRLALQRGDLAQARTLVEEILSHLRDGTLEGAEEAQRVYLTCYQVLRALHDPRAGPLLTAAHDLLQQQAAQIGDADLRRSFLERVAVHGQVVAAYRELPAGHEAGGEGQRRLTVSLPRAGAPRGRSPRPQEYLTVTWTVDAPEDGELTGKVARRRQRIARLLAEAQAQGAAPRDEDLAAALGVSRPTLRRDMAALRAQGHRLPTRGRQK